MHFVVTVDVKFFYRATRLLDSASAAWINGVWRIG